jgi:hypothetical protein
MRLRRRAWLLAPRLTQKEKASAAAETAPAWS